MQYNNTRLISNVSTPIELVVVITVVSIVVVVVVVVDDVVIVFVVVDPRNLPLKFGQNLNSNS